MRTWKQLASMSLSSLLSNRVDSLAYFIGKALRFIFFLVFILALFAVVDTIGGYSKFEVLFFYLTFNLLDVGSQFFLRGIYLLRSEVKKGGLDMILVKPINTLFLIFSRLIDFLDLIFLVPIIGLLVYTAGQLDVITPPSVLLYCLFLLLSSVLILGIHIISAAVTIYTMESDNIIWLYRESMTIGRFPPTILSTGLQVLFTYVIPIIIIVAYPVEAMFSQLTLVNGIIAIVITALFFTVSLTLWHISLRQYSSASN